MKSALRGAVFLVVSVLLSMTAVAQPSGPGWTPVTPPAAGSYRISVGGASNVWIANPSNGQIFRWIGSTWVPMPSPSTPLSDISVARDGTVWGLQSGGSLVSYQSNGTWSGVSGPSGATLTQVSVASYQSAWAVDSNGHVWNGSFGVWSDVSGTWPSTIWRFTQVSAGSDGTVMAVLTNANAPSMQMTAYFAPGIVGPGSWHVLAPQLRGAPVAVGDLRNVWFLISGAIYRMPDTIQAWNSFGPMSALPPQGGTLAQIASSADAVWGIDPAGGLWRYTGSGGCGTNPLADFALDSQMIPGFGPPAISAGLSGTVTIGVERMGGFDDFLTLSAGGVPAGITVTYAMNPLGAGSAQLTISVSPRMQPGTYSFTLTAASSSGATQTTTIQVKVPRRVVGYYANWKYYAGYYPENIETSGSATRLTHVNYAFANVVPDSSTGLWKCQVTDPWADYEVTVPTANAVPGTGSSSGLRGNWNELLKLKARHPQIRTLISVGGWTLSDNFYAAASTTAGRQALVSSCLDLFINGNVPPVTINGTSYPGLAAGAAAGVFDGIDIDWEYPGTCGNNSGCGASPSDAGNFVLLMQEFRNQMTNLTATTQKEYLLTAAMPASYHVYEPPRMDITNLAIPVDFLNLMGYDFHGSWETRTNLHPPLYNPPGNPDDIKYNDDFAVQEYLSYLAAAVPPQPATKVVLGVPFYGYDWTGVGPGPVGTGLYYQPAAGGSAVYNAIKPIVTGSGWTTYQLAGTTYSYNSATQVFWTYDSPTSLMTKGNYVKTNGLGGGMFWELSGDTSNGELITALYNSLQ